MSVCTPAKLMMASVLCLAVLAIHGNPVTAAQVEDESASSFGSIKIPTFERTEKPQENQIQQRSKSSLIEEALNFSSSGNYVKSIEILEALKKRYPEDAGLTTLLMRIMGVRAGQLTSVGNPQAAEALIIRLGELGRDFADASPETVDNPQVREQLATIFFNEACAHARQSDSEKCFASLSDAIGFGFVDVKRILSTTTIVTLDTDDQLATVLGKLFDDYRDNISKMAIANLDSFESFVFDFELPDLDGATVKLSDFSGKLLVVDFWGTWCQGSQNNMKVFSEMRKRYSEQGFEVVGLAYESRSTEETKINNIRRFQNQLNAEYTCLLGEREIQKQVPNWQRYPTALLVDETGKVRAVLVGTLEFHNVETYVKLLLAEEKQDVAVDR